MKPKIFSFCVCFNLAGSLILIFCWLVFGSDQNANNLPWDRRVSLSIPLSALGAILYIVAAISTMAENFSELNIYQDYHRCIDYAERNATRHFWKLMVLSLTPIWAILLSLAILWINTTAAAIAVFMAGSILACAASFWVGKIISARS